ncbi:MAG: glycosyltransferase [Solirubrobacterales bacterium]
MPMNIAFVLPYFADRLGGPVAVAKGTGSALASMGHRVSYWATGTDRDRREQVFGNDVHLFDANWPYGWYRSTGLRRGLEEAIDLGDVLQVHSVWTYPSHAAGRIGGRKGVPYIIRPAGTLQPWALGNGRLKRMKKAAYFRLIAKSLMDRAACVQTASVQEAEQIQRLGHTGPVTVIPNGVDVRGLDEGSREAAETYWPILKDRPVVAFMSRLSPEKGLDLLIPAWAGLIRSPAYRNAVLVVAGPDFRGYQATVQTMICAHGVASSVLLIGMVQGTRKSSLLKRADVFVLPSYSENFGIVVAEALACGAPVITTTSTPWEQLHTVDAGRCVAPTGDQIGQALRELLNLSESRRRQMGARGAALVREDYTWDRVARRFLTVCDCILEGRPIPLHPEPKELKTF